MPRRTALTELLGIERDARAGAAGGGRDRRSGDRGPAIGDGRGLGAALCLGAAGVQIGTAFLGWPGRRLRGLRPPTPRLDATHEYSRTVDGFLRDQAASAADRSILHRVHADVLGPLPEPYFRSDASLPARIALRALRGRGSRSAQRLLESVVARAGRHGRSRVEAQACDLLQRLVQQQIGRGAQMEGLAPGPRRIDLQA
jgi:hypothetical protein